MIIINQIKKALAERRLNFPLIANEGNMFKKEKFASLVVSFRLEPF